MFASVGGCPHPKGRAWRRWLHRSSVLCCRNQCLRPRTLDVDNPHQCQRERSSHKTSNVAISLAKTTGFRRATRVIPVPSLMVDVMPLGKPESRGMSHRGFGACGEGACRGSGKTTCSPVHSDSKPSASARCATTLALRLSEMFMLIPKAQRMVTSLP